MTDLEHTTPAYLLSNAKIEAEQVRVLAQEGGAFSISHIPDQSNDWIELLFDGLTFDLSGFDGPKKPLSLPANQFDIDASELTDCFDLRLAAGPHIKAAANMPAVVRAMMQLLSSLSEMNGVFAVGWEPANSLMSANYFRRVIKSWVNGGPFPALGLAALQQSSDGELESQGLSYFIGQEIRLQIDEDDRASAAKLAVRVIDFLVEAGRLFEERTIEGTDGSYILLSPDPSGKIVKVLQ